MNAFRKMVLDERETGMLKARLQAKEENEQYLETLRAEHSHQAQAHSLRYQRELASSKEQHCERRKKLEQDIHLDLEIAEKQNQIQVAETSASHNAELARLEASHRYVFSKVCILIILDLTFTAQKKCRCCAV